VAEPGGGGHIGLKTGGLGGALGAPEPGPFIGGGGGGAGAATGLKRKKRFMKIFGTKAKVCQILTFVQALLEEQAVEEWAVLSLRWTHL
jgi:hypothetical protein